MSEQQRVKETPTPRPRAHATWVDLMDDTVYREILVDVPPVRVPIQAPPSPEWSSGSLPVSPSSPAVPTLVATPVTTLAATISVGEDEFFKKKILHAESIRKGSELSIDTTEKASNAEKTQDGHNSGPRDILSSWCKGPSPE
ncbi:hypothetical protein Tco_1348132 [Tanacetum coccineum]